MKLAPLLLILLVMPAVAAGVYRWVDAQGNVHYSDQPPPPEANSASQKIIKSGTGTIRPRETQQAVPRQPVTLYATATCGAPCERAKAHLARRSIPYNSADPATSVDANETLRKGGAQPRVPTLMIGNEKLEGYSEAAWDAAFDKAGFQPASPAAPEQKE